MNHGVYVSQKATSVSNPVVSTSGIPYVVGTAPVQMADSPVAAGVPVLCTSWSEAKAALGYSDNWEDYTLCEVMYSHFKLYKMAPVILCNVLDVSTTESVEDAGVAVTARVATLPLEAVKTSVTVKYGDTELAEGEDYELYYSEDALCIELLSGDYYSAAALTVSYEKVTPSAVATSDIAQGIENIDMCLSAIGVIPDLLLAPGWSEDADVAALMAGKVTEISGLFTGKALVDIDASEVTNYSGAAAYKEEGELSDTDILLCWPLVTYGGKTFHLSTHIAGLIAQVDESNDCPYEGPSGKNLEIDGCVDAEGNQILLTLQQANELNGIGVMTTICFGTLGWIAWGNYTAGYPENDDVKDCFIPISRMFDWVGATLIKTFWSKVDKPMNRRFLDSILDSCNIWLNGLVANGYMLGARCEALDEENTVERLTAGIVKLHVYMTPPAPAQEIDFELEYDSSYVTAAFS